jgi:two-component system response regulator NreC
MDLELTLLHIREQHRSDSQFMCQAYIDRTAEIAERLCISRRTVETHRANAMRKLNLNTQTDLLRYALQQGILPSDP